MSLVAAVAVAGLTTANAKPLEEAIKNVDVSGTVVYRYEDRSFKSTGDSDINSATGKRNDDAASNNYKIGLNLKAKANDDVTVVTRFLVAGEGLGFASLNNAEMKNQTTGADIADADANPNVTLSNVYFSYTGIANTTINVGKQGLTTPWTVAEDADGNEQTGTGILALTTVGPVTLAGAYFNQTNLETSTDARINGSQVLNGTATPLSRRTTAVNGVLEGQDNVMTAGAMANVGPVALDGWYLKMIDAFDTYTVGATANFDLDAVKLSVGARHTALTFDETIAGNNMSDEKNKMTKIMLGLKAGIFGANLNYGKTGKEGGLTALDNDATTGMQGWTVQLNGVADATYLQASVNAQVLDSLNLSLNYHKLDKDEMSSNNVTFREEGKDTEIYLQAVYQMSKNFGGYIRLGKADYENSYTEIGGDTEDSKGTIGRLQVQYSF